MEDFTFSSWITNCLLLENSLPTCGDLTVSSRITHYLLVDNSMYSSPCGYLTVSSWITHCLFLLDNLLRHFRRLLDFAMFCRIVFWIAPLGPIYLGDANIKVGIRQFSQICCASLDFPPWTNLSWWCRRYGRTSLIHGNLLLSYPCLVATFIGHLIYCCPFYFMILNQILVYHSLCKTTGQY